MKKLASALGLLVVLVGITVGSYAAFCKDSQGNKFCGHTCSGSGTTCSCTGECSAAELKALGGDEELEGIAQ